MKKIILLWMVLLSTFQMNALDIDDYPDMIDISSTPEKGVDIGPYLHGRKYHIGLFSDCGSWFGFTVPRQDKFVNGFCGPFSIFHRYWFAQSLAAVSSHNLVGGISSYYPGHLMLSQRCIVQKLIFSDATKAVIRIENKTNEPILIHSVGVNDSVNLVSSGPVLLFSHPSGETVALSFSCCVHPVVTGNEYKVEMDAPLVYVTMRFNAKDVSFADAQKSEEDFVKNKMRWNSYLHQVIRSDMPSSYNRIAVKSIVTLLSNWRIPKGGLKHQAIVPSHSSDYFVGWWSWDCWRFSVAIPSFAPQLAKDNIRAIFDYQLPDGMVIDCIHVDSAANNKRDTKPPLCSWAVYEVYKNTKDAEFLKEMYPKLLAYYRWWYAKRDHDGNGICEFGSCDGTLVAAGWESGMDNAIRFDGCKMLKTDENAWSLNQESVDLNCYLANEYMYLKKIADIIGEHFTLPNNRRQIAEYFFDKKIGFFCDRRMNGGKFVEEPGCEGYTPFWTCVASDKQFHVVLKTLLNPAMFSTYIPFPTIAANNPKYDPEGYWRGPIWLDQTYFAISGLRKYREKKLADMYTDQVFTRLQGLSGSAPIYENYDTFTGEGIKTQSNQFSWSAAHLLMLYDEYGKNLYR